MMSASSATLRGAMKRTGAHEIGGERLANDASQTQRHAYSGVKQSTANRWNQSRSLPGESDGSNATMKSMGSPISAKSARSRGDISK